MTAQPTTALAAQDRRLASRIATVMRIGTVIASALLLAGTVVAMLRPGPAATLLLIGGYGLLVLLPAIRLVLMTGHFARLGDTRYVLVTLAVLALVIAGGVIGMSR